MIPSPDRFSVKFTISSSITGPGPLSVVAVVVDVCDRVSEAFRSTVGKYAARTLPRLASETRASSQVDRVSGLFDSARSAICASSSGAPAGGRTRSFGRDTGGGTATAQTFSLSAS